METFFQATIMAFREGLEAFLVISILLKFLDKIDRSQMKKHVWRGVLGGIGGSIAMGLILFKVSSMFGELKTTAKLWESVGAFLAVILVTTFITWMINNGSKLKEHIESDKVRNLSKGGMFLLALFMIMREGAEIVVFSFAGKYEMLPVLVGLVVSIGVVLLINYSLIKVNLKTLFLITLGYLILQAGYLFGYSIHEGLSAAKSLAWISADHPILIKAFDLSGTIFNHKKGIIGLPMNVLLGWYSKPEWIQLIAHYLYVGGLFLYWVKREK